MLQGVHETWQQCWQMHRAMEKKLQDPKAIGNIPSKGTWRTSAPVSWVNLQLFSLDVFSWITVCPLENKSYFTKSSLIELEWLLEAGGGEAKKTISLDTQTRIDVLLQRGRRCDQPGLQIKPETSSQLNTEDDCFYRCHYLNEGQNWKMSMIYKYRQGKLLWF